MNKRVPAPDLNFIVRIGYNLWLLVRLLLDGRISILLKAVPIPAILYALSPLDLIPEMTFPYIGVVDDAFILWLFSYVFVWLAPKHLVAEHQLQLDRRFQEILRGVPQEEDESQDGG